VKPISEAWRTPQVTRGLRRATRRRGFALADIQQSRLATLVNFAAAHSPYYQTLYSGRDAGSVTTDTLHLLPVTTKQQLMVNFESTDRDVTFSAVAAFVADPIGLVKCSWTGLPCGRHRAAPADPACFCTMSMRSRCTRRS
jgi:hypothetical protein